MGSNATSFISIITEPLPSARIVCLRPGGYVHGDHRTIWGQFHRLWRFPVPMRLNNTFPTPFQTRFPIPMAIKCWILCATILLIIPNRYNFAPKRVDGLNYRQPKIRVSGWKKRIRQAEWLCPKRQTDHRAGKSPHRGELFRGQLYPTETQRWIPRHFHPKGGRSVKVTTPPLIASRS